MLSKNFNQSDFEHDAAILSECIPSFTVLVVSILQVVRDQFNLPLIVSSGNRPKAANAAAHGISNSEHIYDADHCAADFYPESDQPGVVRSIFDWMRNNATLPFHQLILEHGKNGTSVIHVSYNRTMPGVRSVLEGSEHNATPYIPVYHVDYKPVQVQS